jgi:ABC-type transporter Mla subunit MlaD
MRGVLLASGLLALILTVLIVGVVRLVGMAGRRIRGRTETLTAERSFAEGVAAGDFDRAELQVRLLLEPAATPGRGRR